MVHGFVQIDLGGNADLFFRDWEVQFSARLLEALNAIPLAAGREFPYEDSPESRRYDILKACMTIIQNAKDPRALMALARELRAEEEVEMMSAQAGLAFRWVINLGLDASKKFTFVFRPSRKGNKKYLNIDLE